MKYFLLTLNLFLISLQAFGNAHLSRQWSRKTLLNPYYKFRHSPKMTPLVTEDMVIQGNATDGIKAFHKKSGHKMWQLAFKNGVEGGAVLDEHRLFFGANNGFFYAVDVNSGNILWSFQTNSESLTRPLVHGPVVFHVSGNDTLYAFNKVTGQSLWVKTNSAKSNMTVRGQTAPVWEKGVLYLGFSDGNFKAINAQTGRELWSKRIGDDKKFNDVDATAVMTKKCVLVASYANSLYCLNKSSGAILWRHDFGGYYSATVIEDKVYYPTVSGEIHVLEAQSGKLIRSIKTVKGMASKVVSLPPYIAYGESDGALVLRDRLSLELLSKFSPGLGMTANPAVDRDKQSLYVISNDSNLYRLDVRTTPENPFHWSHKEYEKR